MKRNRIIFLIVFFFALPFFADSATTTALTVELVATVPGCGDGIIVGGEQCDTANFGGSSCASLGFAGGTLSCTLACTINTSACTSGIFGGGGGGGAVIPLATVVFVGKSSPRSTVTLLKDAQIAATGVADNLGNFQVSISGALGGNYVFSVYSDDSKGIRSALLTFPIYVTFGVITKVSGIFIAPTIAVDKTQVKRGDTISIFGQSVPLSEITISIASDKEFFVKKMTDANGAFAFDLRTSALAVGRYETKAKGTIGGENSPFGKTASFLIGTKNIPIQPSKKARKGDLNRDGRVNLVDFSIAAYWYKRPLSAAFASVEMERLNSDGKVDLIDLSIMAYYWTG